MKVMKKEEKAPVAATSVAKKSEGVENYFSTLDLSALEVSMEEMLKAGVHFGHQKARRNPKMNRYIFTTKKSLNIIDLEKSAQKIKEALDFIAGLRKEGKNILFVGTKPQIKNLVISAAEASGMPYVVERWLGGTFTNFKNIRSRTRYLVESQDKMEKGEFQKYTKFERMKMTEELEKMEDRMGGIKHMSELPAAIFATSIKEDRIAINEAQKMGIPVIAIADTNTDPTLADYPIPANDDALSSVRLILSYACKALATTADVAAKK
ncbi:MAG: 30S ribosomal protein S2 [Candidatus Moranbacteria bacterium GW2011_GWE1_49_15]|nr:MAG: 30S ribosomal protein S2 [Candidatus Moranbacteria bacterium GW2011_GWE2_47_10]KKW07509.1 MAG: 30S ribosomal protein S2 [Candidatus Moranbacteria bacterium GW2011_GWE1_49_15]HBP00862.1 30S ribosomal protein S2 [Candidatus Moranbacteria bacterium]